MAAMNNNVRRYLLLAVLAVVAVLFVRQYLPAVEIPTDGLVNDEIGRLQSKMGDLAVQQKMNEDFEQELVQLRRRASVFWVRTRQGMPVEQEVMEEFNNVARLASVNIQNREPRQVKVPNSNYIQEVEIRIELRGVTMREFSRLLRELSRNRRKFYWVACRIDPDNIQKPTGIRVSGRLRAYLLTEEGTRLLASAPADVPSTQSAAPASSGTPRKAVGYTRSESSSPRTSNRHSRGR